MKNSVKILSVVILGMLLTSCQGAFMLALDIIGTLLLIGIGILVILGIILAIFTR